MSVLETTAVKLGGYETLLAQSLGALAEFFSCFNRQIHSHNKIAKLMKNGNIPPIPGLRPEFKVIRLRLPCPNASSEASYPDATVF